MNIDSILETFDEYQVALNMANNTIEWEGVMLRWFLEYLERTGIPNLTDVDTKTMLKFQVHLSQRKTNKGVAYNSGTQNKCISTVRKFFRMLRRKGEVFIDPTAGMELAKVPRTLPRNIPSVEEILKMLAHPTSVRNRAMLEVLYSTGMRQGELRWLDLNDLNADDQTIFIRCGKGSRDRVVPCGKIAWECIGKYLKEQRPYLMLDVNEKAVFLNKVGTRYSKQGVLVLVKRHCRRAGIERNLSPHCIRHATATHMADAGCDIRYIQELLGHSSPSTTAVYISVSIRRLKEAHKLFHPREIPTLTPDEKIA